MLAHASYDVLVVGARCAGAATAMLLARRGLRALAIDRAEYGTDTISTHALMRGGVLQLHRWGVLPWLRRQGLPAIRATTFHYDDEAVPIAIRPAHGVEALYAPRRILLDSMLADVAEQAGATVRYGHTLARLAAPPDGRVCGATVLDAAGKARTIKADLVVGADGIGSSVARLSGAPIVREARNTTAVVYGHFQGHRSDRQPLVVSRRHQRRRHSHQPRPALHLRGHAARPTAHWPVARRQDGGVPRGPGGGGPRPGGVGCPIHA